MIYDGVEKGIMQDGPSHQQAQTQDHCMSMYIYIYIVSIDSGGSIRGWRIGFKLI